MSSRRGTVADPDTLQALRERLRSIHAASPRRWGTMTPHEMLCHLGDATAMVLRIRPRTRPVPTRRRPIVKWLALQSPLPWPRGFPTSASLDPKAEGTRPSELEADRARAIDGLERLAAAAPEGLEPVHGVFGEMSLADWQRWAYRHTDHHLRQFGA